jgi:hypothetical protein
MFRTSKSTNCPLPSGYYPYIFNINLFQLSHTELDCLWTSQCSTSLFHRGVIPHPLYVLIQQHLTNQEHFLSDERWEGESNKIFYVILYSIPYGGKRPQLHHLIRLFDHAGKGAMTPKTPITISQTTLPNTPKDLNRNIAMRTSNLTS